MLYLHRGLPHYGPPRRHCGLGTGHYTRCISDIVLLPWSTPHQLSLVVILLPGQILMQGVFALSLGLMTLVAVHVAPQARALLHTDHDAGMMP